MIDKLQAVRRKTRAAKFKRTTDPSDPKNRLIATLGMFTVIGAGFIAVLVDLQTVRSDEYKEIAAIQRTSSRTLSSGRGAIVDRNGVVLASTIPSFEVIADPHAIDDPAATSAVLAPLIGQDEAALEAKLLGSGKDDRYELIAPSVNPLVADEIRAASSESGQLVGVHLRAKQERSYSSSVGIGVVGRVSSDQKGIDGIEHQYDDIMTGRAGSKQFERNNFGGSIAGGFSKVTPAQNGFDVVLTIDSRLQHLAEQELLNHCQQQGAKGASAVLSEPATGEILVSASVSQNEQGRCIVSRYNKPVVDAFEPGSVIKPLVVAAASDRINLTADSVIAVPESITLGQKKFEDHPPVPAASYSVKQILAESMNVGTIAIASKLSVNDLYNTYRQFGIGQNQGLGLKGETRGRLREPDQWWGADQGSMAIGQGLSVNLTQINSAFNVFATRGIYTPPKLVKSLRSPEGRDLFPEAVVTEKVISSASAEQITQALVGVVADGTGSEARIDDVIVAGKTGTAWKVFEDDNGRYGYGQPGNRRYTTVFSGYYPAHHPQLSLSVVVDEPAASHFASKVAAPLFRDLARKSFGFYNIGEVHDTQTRGLARAKATAGIEQDQTSVDIIETTASEPTSQGGTGGEGND